MKPALLFSCLLLPALALAVAEANRSHALAEQERAQSLLKTGGITAKDSLSAEVALQVAEASVAQVKAEAAISAQQLSRTEIRAPFAAELPAQVTIECVPRGGRIVFAVGAREPAVYLPDRRFDLMVALLRDYREGEFITDAELRSIVYGGLSFTEVYRELYGAEGG